MINLNKYGEIHVNKNEVVFSMPITKMNEKDIENIEKNYKEVIEKNNYPSQIIYVDSIGELLNRITFEYNASNTSAFHNIRKIPFKEVMPYFKSLIDIARMNLNVLWEKDNFVIDMNENKFKVFIFEFQGLPLYSSKNALNGLKENILLSLTTKNRILGKPRRNEFVEQEDYVIEFAEEILRCQSVDEIEKVVEDTQLEIELQKEKKEEQKRKKAEKSKIYALKQKFYKKAKEKSHEEKIKEQLQISDNQTERGKTSIVDKITSPKGMIVSIGAVICMGIMYYATDGFAGEALEEEKVMTEVKKRDEILETYRSYIDGDKDLAYAKLDKIGYKNLSNKRDKKILLEWYIEQDQYTKAISTDEKGAYMVGDYLIKERKIDELKKVAQQIDSKVLKFDIASIDGKYQAMIENNDIQLNKRRAKEMVKAYAMTNQERELKDYIKTKDEKSKENLMDYQHMFFDQYHEAKEKKEEIDVLKGKQTLLHEKIKKEKNKKKKNNLNAELEKTNKNLKNLKKEVKTLEQKIENE